MRKKNTKEFSVELLVVGSAASVASRSTSRAASATSVGRTASISVTSSVAAVLSPDGGGGLLTDPSWPRGGLRPLGWWVEFASSPLLGLSLQVLNLGLEHVDEQLEAMGQRMDRVGAPDVLTIVVNQGKTG